MENPFVRQIDLSHNLIREITNNDLKLTKNNTFHDGLEIKLQHNLIENINVDDSYSNYEEYLSFVSIDISRNPIVCECNNDEKILQDTIVHKNGITFTISTHDQDCDDVLCCEDERIYEDELCPSQCYCVLCTKTKIMQIDCSERQLNQIPPMKDTTYHYYISAITIDMSNNSLTVLDLDDIRHYQVSEINAAFNEISSLNALLFHSDPLTLNLTNNKFKILNDYEIKQILDNGNNLKIFFGKNPWICGPQFDKMRNDLRFIIKDSNEMHCMEETVVTSKHSSTIIIYLVIISIFFIIGFSSFIAYRKFRNIKTRVDNFWFRFHRFKNQYGHEHLEEENCQILI